MSTSYSLDARLLHVAQVAKQRESAELATRESRRSHASRLSRPARKALPPRCREWQLAFDEPLPERGLLGVTRLRVAEEQHVAQPNGAGAVVLGERVLVELA